MEDEQFSQERVEEIIDKYNDGEPEFTAGYSRRCELVYNLHKETAKPGCNGGFRAVLRRINLATTTAYDMVARHQIAIGEKEDPDALDPRDEEEEINEESEETESAGSAQSKRKRNARARQAGQSRKVTLTLSGDLAEAVTAVQKFFHKTNAKEAITFCVIRAWGALTMPIAKQSTTDDSLDQPAEAPAAAPAEATESLSEDSDESPAEHAPTPQKPKRKLLDFDDDDLPQMAQAVDERKPVTSVYQPYQHGEGGNEHATA